MDSNGSNDSTYGIIGVIVVVILIGWSFVSSSNQRNEANLETISSAVSDVNYQISELYSSARGIYGNINDECDWQADELSGNIGDVCQNNTTGSYSLDDGDSYEIDENTYTSMLEDGTTIDDVVSEMVDDANSNYTKIIDTMDSITSALKDQCSWIEDNIDDEIASECYEAGEGFSYEWRSPFNTYDYLDD